MTFSSHFLRVPKCFHVFFSDNDTLCFLVHKAPTLLPKQTWPILYNKGLKNQTKGIHCVFFGSKTSETFPAKLLLSFCFNSYIFFCFLEHTSWSNVKCRKVSCRWSSCNFLNNKRCDLFNLRDEFLRDSLDSYRDEFLIQITPKVAAKKIGTFKGCDQGSIGCSQQILRCFRHLLLAVNFFREDQERPGQQIFPEFHQPDSENAMNGFKKNCS